MQHIPNTDQMNQHTYQINRNQSIPLNKISEIKRLISFQSIPALFNNYLQSDPADEVSVTPCPPTNLGPLMFTTKSTTTITVSTSRKTKPYLRPVGLDILCYEVDTVERNRFPAELWMTPGHLNRKRVNDQDGHIRR